MSRYKEINNGRKGGRISKGEAEETVRRKRIKEKIYIRKKKYKKTARLG